MAENIAKIRLKTCSSLFTKTNSLINYSSIYHPPILVSVNYMTIIDPRKCLPVKCQKLTSAKISFPESYLP